MGILRLGGVKVRALDLQKSVNYYTNVMGLQKVAEKNGEVYLKGWDEFDHHSLILTQADSAGHEHLSLKVRTGDDMVFFRNKLEGAGVKVENLAEGSELGMGAAIGFKTPSGHNVKLYAEMEQPGIAVGTTNPDPWPDDLKGIGCPRLDHMLLAAEDPQKTTDFFMHLLGFWMSERIVTKQGENLIASWLTCSNSMHDIAVIAGPGPGKVHHFAYLLEDWTAIRNAADIMAKNNVMVDYGPTRHGVSRGLTIYFFDPSGNRNEVFAGSYPAFPDAPLITWTDDVIGKAVFYMQRELNERFTTVFT